MNTDNDISEPVHPVHDPNAAVNDSVSGKQQGSSTASDDTPKEDSQQASTVPRPTIVTPATADDVDLIEKVWVEKAKEIVDGTINDPYTQSRQINQIKVDYIKKRYNKDLKVED